MKKNIIYVLSVVAGLLFTLASCNKFDYDEPDMSDDVYMSDTEATGINTTLAEVKQRYKALITDSNNRNQWQYVEEDVVFDGYVCANDISGNLYQAIYVRKGDDAIVVGINDNSLWTTYPVGTHVVLNLKGLYIGSYGNLAKIGMPYTTSGGNKRLGGMPKFMASECVKVIGFKHDAPETEPVLVNHQWLSSKTRSNDEMHKWSPMLVRVENAEIQGYRNRKVYAVYDDRDAGNGVNDVIIIDGQKYTLRQSALSDFSSDTIPTGKVNVIAVLTRYSNEWQMSLRDASDVTPVLSEMR